MPSQDIFFYDSDAGLLCAERELSATVTSRFEGRRAEALRATALDDLAISNVIHKVALLIERIC